MANEAYKLRGTKQPIAFGVEKLEGYIVDATEDTVEGQELEVENEDGNVVAHFSGFGIKYNRTASVIPLSDASAPSPGDSFKIGEKFEFIVKSVKKSRARKDVEKWDCPAPGIWPPFRSPRASLPSKPAPTASPGHSVRW